MTGFTDFMHLALEQAQMAADASEVPVGAVIISAQGELISSAQNRMLRDGDATAHAECLAIRAAMQTARTSRLEGCDLWVTLEPCAMCAGAIAHARLRRVYYAAEDIKGGAVDNGPRLFSQPTIHHRPEVISGIAEAEARQLLTAFFAARRSPTQNS